MQKIFIFLAIFCAALQPATAQLANWTAYKSTKFATNLSGQIHGQARINQLKFHHSNPNKFYAITPQGGLFISNDAGTNWAVAPGTDILTSRFGSICIDYTDDQVLYLGSGDPNYWGNGAGVFKSTNGGNTFAQLNTGLPTNRIVAEILMHPTDHNTLVAATNGGIYKTTDAGATWTAKTATSLQFCSMQSNTAANSHILYATTQTTTPQFYRSTDFGETWTLITSGISDPAVLPLQSGSRVAVTSADANVVYFAMVASGGIVYKSTDGGLNFTQTKAGGSPYLTFYADDINDSGQGNYNFCIGVDNVDANKIWLQSHNTWYSNNSGSTWTMLTHWASRVHTDMHQIGQSPYNSNHLYSCNDGGVWLSTDGGNNWTPKNDGLFAYEIPDYSGKGSPTRKDFISIGTQDNGRLYADSTGWYTIGGGDDYTKREVDKRANGTAVYFIGDPAGFSVSGVGQRRIVPTGGNTSYNLPGGVTIVEALAFNRTNNNLAFLGSSNIYRSNDVLNNTPTWTQISNFSTPIMHIHSCIANPNRLYVVTNDQKMYVSNDALSANPTFAMYNLPAASNNTATVTAISNNADIVYIAINNRVYRSADGGQNWANITYNLPSANHRRILAEEYDGTEELVLVATSNAVYYKKAGQVTWTNYSTNLPSRKSPTDFSMYDDGSNQAVIRYASYGRSIWETPFHNIRATRAVVAAATTNACSDATWKFADASTGDIASRVWSFTSGTPSNSTDAHPTVTYAATGTYNVTLTVTDALGNTASTMYQAIVNDLNKCDADTIPGNALSQSATTDYLLMNAPLNISTNTITFSAWVKPNGMQSSTTGLIMSGSNGATGIHLRNSNRLSYHWNNESGSYNFSGPTIPSDVWSHIAVVVTPSSATFYLNGVPTVRNASHVAVNFNSAFYIGNDRGNISRTFKGLMDEVCIYNRSLTTNEIREMMHLTKNPTADPNLLAYYQMNEPSGNLILNHAQTIHATLQGNATRNTSTAPVGGGLSERQGIASSGAKNFSTVGVILAFPNTGTLPNGDVVVTRLNVPPDQKPTPTIVPQNGYYIINNFGTNSTFETLTSIQFDNLPNIGSGYSTGQFGFYKRSSVADGNTWGSVADRADTFVPNGQNSSLTFSTGNNINNFSQFALTPTYATAGNDAWLCSGESVGIGDVPMSGLTYSWSPAAGLSATNISNPTASPTTTTTYTLTVTETASGMTFTDDVVVSIHSVPLLSAASITPTPASATVCGGGSVLMTASGGSAPAFVELGNGASVTTGNSVGSELGPNPLQNYYGGSKQQMLFTAAELHALGITTGAQLSGFGVNLSTAGTSYALNDLKISIQHTSLVALSTFVMSGWTTVRNAANYTPTAGWNTIPFNTNFTWDGLSNLLIEITYSNNNGGSGGTRNTAFFGTTNFVSTLFYRNDSQTSATIEAYSGAPSYSYSLRNNVRFALSGTTNYTWSPIAGLNAATGSNVTATPSTTTTYTVSATFSGACPATASQVVTVNANPSLSLAASCSGGPGTGVLTPTFVAGSGGTASYNPSTLTGLSNGNYTVTVTESPSGCTATASATINCTVQCPDLSAAAPAATVGSQSTCSNCNLSGGTLAAPSGTCPTGSTLQYSTDGGTNWTTTLPTYDQTTAMTILTRCNCNSDTNQSSPTSSVTTVPGVCTPVTATISGTATACDMVQLTASGGASYAWSGGASPSTAINTFSTSGTYTVTVTGSNGCTATASQVVTVNANPSLSLAASCSGGPGTGVLTPTFVAGSGGTASYNPSTLTGLSNGNYTVTVTESPSGCTATASATINCTVQCPDLSAAAPAATVGSQSTCSNCALSGGTLAAPSGTCPTGSTLQYSTDGGTSWSTTLPTYDQTTAMTILTRCNCNSDTNQSSPTSSVTTVPGVCTPVTATISGTATACDMVQLTASGGASYAWSGGASPSTAINTFSTSGTYTVTVTGSNGCTATASQAVTVNANPSLSLAASCSGGPGTGVLTPTFVAGSGGTASYNPSTLTGLSNGNYTVTVTESPSGCTATASATINCTVQCPDLSAAAPAATVSSQSTCSNCNLSGGILAAPSGTCPTGSTLQYSTDGGTSWTATLPTYDQTTAMTILTRCNCDSDTNQSSPTSSVTTVPGVCTPVIASISGTATSCDMVQLTASGGTSYAWSGGASPSTATNTFSASGTYTVTVTGSNGCTASASQVVTVNANPSLSVAASCSGGPGTGVLTPTFVAGSGGTASYNPSTLTGLSNGNYTVTVTESPSGCTATASATINCTVQCPDLSAAAPAATVSSESTCSNCTLSGGVLAAPSGVCPTGSTLQYSTDGGTSWTATLPTYNPTSAMTILTRCNCDSDTNQSSPTSSVTTVPGVCTPISASISGTATGCDMVQLSASGGTSYAWSGGASPSTAINTFSASGTYTVTVTGSNGCTASASQVVTVNANPTANITGPSSVCVGSTLALTASGGVSYAWGGPGGFAAATATMSRTGMTAAMAGTYTVTVTNASGCTATASRTVAVNALPAATAGSNSPVCTGAAINLTASGGVTYAWSGPGFSSSLQNPSRGSATLAMAGTYTVTVTNASGCTATASTTVAVNSCGAVLNVVSYSIGKDNGTSNGSITLNVAGGTPCTGNTYNYAWSGPSSGSATGGSSFVISPLATGWYIITITDCAGNSKVVSYFVPLATRGRTKSEGIPFEGLAAYPNPTSDVSTIKFTSWSNERMYLAVYSMEGREVAVLFDGIAEEEADYELPLSVSDLAAGVYNVLLASQSGRKETLRLVITK